MIIRRTKSGLTRAREAIALRWSASKLPRLRRLPPTSLLSIPLLLFVLGAFWDRQAHRSYDRHRHALAEAGGGVLFVMQPRDCTGISGSAQGIGARLSLQGIPVRGLIMPGRASTGETQTVLAMANDLFPHFVIGNRAVAALAEWTGIRHTPVALVVDASGTLTTMLNVNGQQPRVLADLLAARVRDVEPGGSEP